MAQDPSQAVLEALLRQSHGQGLWLVDENISPPAIPALSEMLVVGNRFDRVRSLGEHGWNAQFSDFDLSRLESATIDQIFYRVSKEKAVVHHLINESARVLRPGGELILVGEKNDGIKTYARKAQMRLGGERTERKQGNVWTATLIQSAPGEPLDDQHYNDLRALLPTRDDSAGYLTKPGLFGWNKIDQGSAYLIEELPGMLNQALPLHQPTLDLGCGFGYLALNACDKDTELVCTDNNAAALAACRANLEQRGFSNARVIASDAGDCVQGAFDIILCNPPFHAGFSIEGDLTDRFLQQTQRLLKPAGTACFVVNQHIPLERKAHNRFAQVHTHADNGHFKLITLKQPR
ncbi:MAG: rRNA methyltransferase [Oceanospirillaceae bacterium]|nr:rRNA methyltransferase [Oceanospirillaceae bacterium]